MSKASNLQSNDSNPVEFRGDINAAAALDGSSSREKLLIVEPKEATAKLIREGLEDSYDILGAEDRRDAIRLLRQERPQAAVVDLHLLPDGAGTEEGLRALEELTGERPALKVIVVAGEAEKDQAFSAIMQGAYDFFCQPLNIEELKVVLRRAFYLSRVEAGYQELRSLVPVKDSFEGMLGVSPQIHEVFNNIPRVAGSDVAVLITGESGTGKELVARGIHNRSYRKDGPFVAINCGAIPENLIESELFGHERGALTGAHNQRKGRIEMANKGTLFLDEIGELPPGLQVKLLRFLDRREMERVGGNRQIQVDLRVIAATNRNIRLAIRQGTFRQDFYHRIGVVEIELPALREREGDIDYLANFYLRSVAHENQKKLAGFAPSAIKALRGHSWPGNVRELQNKISRAVLLARGPKITRSDLELSSIVSPYDGMTLREAREAVETELIRKSMKRQRGNLSRMAAELGISRPSLYETLTRLGIERPHRQAFASFSSYGQPNFNS